MPSLWSHWFTPQRWQLSTLQLIQSQRILAPLAWSPEMVQKITTCQLLDSESTNIVQSFHKFSSNSVGGNQFVLPFNSCPDISLLREPQRGSRRGHRKWFEDKLWNWNITVEQRSLSLPFHFMLLNRSISKARLSHCTRIIIIIVMMTLSQWSLHKIESKICLKT